MLTSKFCSAPRIGYFERMKQVYEHLCKHRHYNICFCVDEPDYFVPKIPDNDWEQSVYGKHKENIADDVPAQLGKRIILTHYFDESLMYDVVFGKNLTSACTFYNKTPISWYCKQQSTSKIAT